MVGLLDRVAIIRTLILSSSSGYPVAFCCCLFVHIRRVHWCCCPSGSLLIACSRLPTLDVLSVCPVGGSLLLVCPQPPSGSLLIASDHCPLRLSCCLLLLFVHIRHVRSCCCPSGSLLIACSRLPTLDVLSVCPVGCLLLLLSTSAVRLSTDCFRPPVLSVCHVACCCCSFTSVVSVRAVARPALY